nr:MAG TPA: hypothetical protein [Caudoviricetes sp.]
MIAPVSRRQPLSSSNKNLPSGFLDPHKIEQNNV